MIILYVIIAFLLGGLCGWAAAERVINGQVGEIREELKVKAAYFDWCRDGERERRIFRRR